MLARLFFKNYLLSRRSGALVRRIAWLCMVATALGVAALIIVLSVMSGFNRTIRANMFAIEPQIVVSLKNKQSWDEAQLDRKLSAQMNANIKSIYPFESRDLILRSQDGNFSGSLGKGYPPEAIRDFLRRVWLKNNKGDHSAPEPQQTTVQLNSREVIIGSDLARNLGVYEGDEILLIPPESILAPKGEMPRFDKYRIRSVVSTQLPELDGQLLIYALSNEVVRAKMSVSAERGYEIRLHDPYQYKSVVAQIKDLGLPARDWTERNTSLFFALKMERIAMTLFLSLAVLITSFSIVTAMVLVMSQKRRDIGMMMAMGFSQKMTKRLFLSVGLFLGFFGIGSGMLLGLSVSILLHIFPLEVLPDIYQDTILPVDPSWQIALSVLLGSGFLAIMGAWLPVARFRQFNPSENLKSS